MGKHYSICIRYELLLGQYFGDMGWRCSSYWCDIKISPQYSSIPDCTWGYSWINNTISLPKEITRQHPAFDQTYLILKIR